MRRRLLGDAVKPVRRLAPSARISGIVGRTFFAISLWIAIEKVRNQRRLIVRLGSVQARSSARGNVVFLERCQGPLVAQARPPVELRSIQRSDPRSGVVLMPRQ